MTEFSSDAIPAADASVRFGGLLRDAGLFIALLAAVGLVSALLGTAVTEPPVVAGFTAGPLVRYGIPFARIVLDFGVAAAVGLAIVPKLLGFDRAERTEPVLAPTRRYGVWASGLWVAAALTSIVLLAAEMTAGEWLTPASVWRYVTSIAAGKGLMLSAACGLISWWLCRLSVRHGEKVPAELRTGVALFGLLPLPLTGHASNWYYHDLSMVSMELHVTASSLWAGGLAVLVVVLARHRDLLAIALPKFSRLATWCVFVVGLSGIANGLLELYLSPITRLPSSLWETRYGVMLIAKAACFAAVAVIAIVVRSRVMPAVAAGRRTAFAAWCGWEVAVLTVAFGVAVVLTRAEVTAF
ncbi:MAG: CopD family protein [Nakamurella sp.]